MKIKYPILWIDDNRDYYETQKHDVIDHIQSHGMIEAIRFSLPESAQQAVRLIEKYNPYLVVLDYKLGGGMTGDFFIRKIREENLFHEILFYSQDGFDDDVFQNFFSSVESPLATGVNFCPKGEVALSKICSLIDLKLSQFADLSTQRGWIVADSIVLENKLNDAILKLSKIFPTPFHSSMKRIVKDSARADFGCRKILFGGMLSDLLSYLNSVGYDKPVRVKIRECKVIFNSFSDNVVELRNTIAHQPEENSSGTLFLKPRQKSSSYADAHNRIFYSEEFLKKVRSNFVRHSENIENLLDIFSKISLS